MAKKKPILRAKHRPGHYKSEARWLYAIYQHNKALIDAAYAEAAGEIKSPYRNFRAQVEEYRTERGFSISEALGILGRTEKFRGGTGLWWQKNVIDGLKTAGVYKDFQTLSRVKGRFVAPDPSKLVYVGDRTYIYDNRVSISFRNSPVAVYVRPISKEDAKTARKNYEDYRAEKIAKKEELKQNGRK